jgi:hypothetical protein
MVNIKAILFMAAIFLAALITFNFIGFLQPVNPIINRAFPEAPDISCMNDSDCVLAIPSKLSECAICDPYGCKMYSDSLDDVVAVSKSWQPRCIFSKPPGECVLDCIGGVQQKDYEPKCINGQCVKSRKET